MTRSRPARYPPSPGPDISLRLLMLRDRGESGDTIANKVSFAKVQAKSPIVLLLPPIPAVLPARASPGGWKGRGGGQQGNRGGGPRIGIPPRPSNARQFCRYVFAVHVHFVALERERRQSAMRYYSLVLNYWKKGRRAATSSAGAQRLNFYAAANFDILEVACACSSYRYGGSIRQCMTIAILSTSYWE